MILVIEPFYQSIFSDAGYAKGVVVTSTGGAYNKYSKKYFGVYKSTGKIYYGKPVYKHSFEQAYLFFNANKNWVIYDQPNKYSGYMYAHKSKSDPTYAGWKYWDKAWKADPTMKVESGMPS